MPSPSYGSLPFAEQIAFFRQKVNLGTQRWDDILGAAHDRAFVVAGAAKADLLADLRAAVTKAIEQGTTLAEFRKDFEALVARHGWTGWTGEGTAAGRAWRTRIIYETNLRASYAAGRWAQIQQVKAERPYLLYRHNDNVLHPRPLHVAWDGKVIAADDPWWRTHFPPNGWGCQCRVHAVDDAYLRKLGKAGPDPAPDDGTYDYFNKVSGITLRDIPKGIDPGWDYAPGASLNLQEFITDKAAKLPGPIAQQFVDAVAARTAPPVFVPQKTAKEAAAYAVKENLADFADYTGVKPEVANEWNRSLFDHLQRYPSLRAKQKFVGTGQGQYAYWQNAIVEERLPLYRQFNTWATDEQLRAEIKKSLPKPKVSGKTYAHSWDDRRASGVAINSKWGNNPDRLKAALKQDVETNWHPPGCDTIRSIVDHELGHQLDTLLGAMHDPEIKALWSNGKDAVIDNVSRYAATNIREMIAEGWAEYLNSTSPRPWALKIGQAIERLYANRFPSP